MNIVVETYQQIKQNFLNRMKMIAPHGYDASMAFIQLSIRHDTILDHSILKYMATKKVSYQGKKDENVTGLGAVTF